MEWIQPKTDWSANDYINYSDYNRIRNNIMYLAEKAQSLYPNFSLVTTIPQVTRSTYAYAEIWNKLEDAAQEIVDKTYPLPSAGSKKTFQVYDPYINYVELNRLESLTLRYESLFKSMENTGERLPFTLGNYGGIKE